MNKLYRSIVKLLKHFKDSLISVCRGNNDESVGYEPTTGLLVELLEAVGDYSTNEIKFRLSYCGKRKTFSVHVRDKDNIPSMFVLNSSSRIELTQHNINMAIYWIWGMRQTLEVCSDFNEDKLVYRGRKADMVILDDICTRKK